MRIDTSTDVRELLEQNIKLSKLILTSSEKTRKALRFMKIMSLLRLLIIVIPLILAVLYIPPYLSSLTKSISGLSGGEQLNIFDQFKNAGVNLQDIQNFLKQTK